MNRAISGLVGMGAVSAEEVDASAGLPGHEPVWAQAADHDTKAEMLRGLTEMLGDRDRAIELGKAIAQECGHVPVLMARVLGNLPRWRIDDAPEEPAEADVVPDVREDESEVAQPEPPPV
jgi:hypothetical protein